MNRSSDRDIAIVGATGGSPLPSSPQSRNRRSIRLRGYDYSQAGAYFVTICTQNRECLFGAITRGEMRLNEAGLVVADEWMKTAVIRDEIELDAWVVMPNHFHGILVITGSGAATHGRGRPFGSWQGRPAGRPYGSTTRIGRRGHGWV